MYTVSPGYNDQNFRALRNAAHVKIAFGVVDPQGALLSSPEDNGHLDYSAVDRIDMGIGVSQTYQTLEHNRFILDGRNLLAEHEDFLYQGYVGTAISNAAGVWEDPPVITINFSEYTKFSALTFNFDTTMDNYPVEMQITAYYDDDVVRDETVYPDKAETWIYENGLPTLNKLVITFLKSSVPYRRARILSLLWGFTQELTENDIAECAMKRNVEMLSAALPSFTFNFTMLDQNKRYDPESPDTLWDYLESLQPVNVQIGIDLDDGSIEWIPLCNLYTTGDVAVGSQGVVTEVTFKTKSLLQHFDTKFTHGLWRPNNPISLFDLAQEVVASVEYDKTVIFDDVLKDIYTSSPLPVESVATCLQLIANAGRCVLDTNRNGAITITPYVTSEEDFLLDFHSMTEPPSTSKVPPLRDVITAYTIITPDEAISNLTEVTIQDVVAGDVISVKHQAATEQGITTIEGSGITIAEIRAYTYATELVIGEVAEGAVQKFGITGRTLNTSTVDVVKRYNELGQDCSISNELVDTYSKALEYADWIASINMRRNDYQIPNRGFIELDTQDDITIETNFESKVLATVTANEINYNGAISGSTKCMIVKKG